MDSKGPHTSVSNLSMHENRSLGNRYIYGGLSHVELTEDSFDLGEGVYLKRTYAHLAAPHIMAFAPAPPGGHHPAPWRPASGGFSYDIEVEIGVPTTSVLPGGFSPEDTIWLVAALLRLARYPFLIIPVISDVPFSEAAHSKREPTLRPFETEHRILQAATPEGRKLDMHELEWVKAKWISTSHLMQRSRQFNLAVRACDACTVQGRTSASMLAVWGGLEQLFAVSAGEIRFRVSSYLASYLEPPGQQRFELFKKIMEVYNTRSKAAHTAGEIDSSAFVQSYVLLRNALVQMIDANSVPTQADLEQLLFCASDANQTLTKATPSIASQIEQAAVKSNS